MTPAVTVAMERVLASVREARPDLIDRWEITATIEAAGYSDRRIREELGVADARVLGEMLYVRLTREGTPAPPERASPSIWRRVCDAAGHFAVTFSSGVVYTVPWLAMFWLQQVRPDAFAISSVLAVPLSFALMASLVGTGGFVQAIVRKGVFYLSLPQPAVAYDTTRRLFECGAACALVTAAAGVAIGAYFGILPLPVLLAAGVSYVTFSMLWMLCALITVGGQRWRVPAVFAAGGAVFTGVYLNGGGALAAQTAALYGALVAAGVFAGLDRARCTTALPRLLPRTRVLLHQLAPYFWYGTLYFSLLFADRVIAAAARRASGAAFVVDPGYTHAIEIALVTFLIVAAIVEHLNGVFMRFLRARMHMTDGEDPRLRQALARKYLLLVGVIVVGFPALDSVARTLAAALRPAADEAGLVVLTFASLGYLLLSIGLFNSLILLSLGRPFAVVSSFGGALAVDVLCGGAMAVFFGPHFAAAGLAAGSAFLVIRTTAKVADLLSAPGHAFCTV